jgi:hypothetical protein
LILLESAALIASADNENIAASTNDTRFKKTSREMGSQQQLPSCSPERGFDKTNRSLVFLR